MLDTRPPEAPPRPAAPPVPKAPAPRPAPVRRSLLISGIVVAVAVVVVAAVLATSGGGTSLKARLSAIRPVVESAKATGAFSSVSVPATLHEGDRVRTDASGEAQLDYPDGSLTRLDVNTEFSLVQLAEKAGHRAYRLGQKVGRSWNRVTKLTSSESRFQVETSNAVAAVRGTTFIVECLADGTCTYTVIEGHVLVTTKSGRQILLGPNESVTVGPDFSLGNVKQISLSDLVPNDPFIADNVRRDGVPVTSPSSVNSGPGSTPTGTTTDSGGSPSSSPGTGSTSSSTGGTTRSSRASGIAGGTVGSPVIVPVTPPGSGTATFAPTSPSTPPLPRYTGPGRIAFVSDRAGTPDIYVLAANGSVTRLTTAVCDSSGQCGSSLNPAWSPDGSHIAFGQFLAPDWQITVMNADGSGAHGIDAVPGTAGAPAITWSPDDTRIAFAAPDGINIENVDGSGRSVVPNTSGADWPAWSPDGGRFVYSSGYQPAGTLEIINVDGSGHRHLSSADAVDKTVEPTWSPDGSTIAFAGHGPLCSGSIFVVRSDDSAPATEIAHHSCEDADPSWSADGSRITFDSFGSNDTDLWSVKPDGTGLVRLTHTGGSNSTPSFSGVGLPARDQGFVAPTPPGQIAYTGFGGEIESVNPDGTTAQGQANLAVGDEPAVSPDRSLVAFHVTDQNGLGEIHVMDSDFQGQRTITSGTDDREPAWSPDGTRIAFTTTRTGNDEVFVMNADGTGQTNVSNSPLADSRPAWSPDGTHIAFSSNRDTGGVNAEEVYVMNANGTGQTRLTNNPANDSSPDWSPDGSRIAFSSSRDGNQEIYLMNADGSNPVRVTNDPSYDDFPAWSPDGTRLAFQTQRTGNDEIFVMNIDGSALVNVSNSSGSDTNPDW